MVEWFYVAPKEGGVKKHYGPGKHPSGSPQAAHAGGKWGKGGRRRRREQKKWRKVGTPKGKPPALGEAARHYSLGGKAIAAGRDSVKQMTKKEFTSLFGLGGGGRDADTFNIGLEFGRGSKEHKRAVGVSDRAMKFRKGVTERLKGLLRKYAAGQLSDFAIRTMTVTSLNAAMTYDFLSDPEGYAKRLLGTK